MKLSPAYLRYDVIPYLQPFLSINERLIIIITRTNKSHKDMAGKTKIIKDDAVLDATPIILKEEAKCFELKFVALD